MDPVVIRPRRSSVHYWAEVWKFRELLGLLAWRDLLVRYKQTSLGILWALLRPLLSMLILTLVFSYFGKLPSGPAPYALMVLCGLLPWQLFSAAMSESGNSLVNSSYLIAKVYFPRLIVPISSLVPACMDFLASLGLLSGLMLFHGYAPSPNLVFLPLFIVLALAASLAMGIGLSALIARYRDIRYILPFAVQMGLFLSPVGMQTRIVPEQFRLLYSLNPMVGIIDGFRWSILGDAYPVAVESVVISAVVVAVLLGAGVAYFRAVERTFADIL